jgi:hypothetical protein
VDSPQLMVERLPLQLSDTSSVIYCVDAESHTTTISEKLSKFLEFPAINFVLWVLVSIVFFIFVWLFIIEPIRVRKRKRTERKR